MSSSRVGFIKRSREQPWSYQCDTHENLGISCSISYMNYIGQCDLINTCFRLLQVWYTPGGQHV